MTVEYRKCDLFSVEADAIVNTVNTVGVMGKGVALKMKKLSKNNFDKYVNWCNLKKYGGDVFLTKPNDFDKYIFNVATKGNWRKPSNYTFIESILKKLVWYSENKAVKHGIQTVAMPALGCGCGGLDWVVVKALIKKYLDPLENIHFIVCEY